MPTGDAVAAELLAILEEERLAAVKADVERLLSIQEPKAAAVKRCLDAMPSEAQLAVLGEKARENIALMRHLSGVLRTMITVEQDQGYGASGERVPAEVAVLRGRA